jgi:hypothetical protein
VGARPASTLAVTGQDQSRGRLGDLEMHDHQDAGLRVGGQDDAGVTELLLHGLQVRPSRVGRVAAPWRRSCNRTGGSPGSAASVDGPWFGACLGQALQLMTAGDAELGVGAVEVGRDGPRG